jgi:hypothetical protein
MLRSATLALALLILPPTAGMADASHCGQASELAVARARWAVSRQSRIDPAEIEKVCRAYANNFYEAVVTRQAASLCEDGVSRQRDLEMLDAAIDAFNNMIAAECAGS